MRNPEPPAPHLDQRRSDPSVRDAHPLSQLPLGEVDNPIPVRQRQKRKTD